MRETTGVTLTRSEIGWQVQVEQLPIYGCRIVDNTGRRIVASVYNEELAKQIVAEHNAHAALVAERDRLRLAMAMAADTAERASFVQDRSVGIIKQTCALIASDLHEALATGKQGGETR